MSKSKIKTEGGQAMTNYEIIKSMNSDEMARFLMHNDFCVRTYGEECSDNPGFDCSDHINKWLNQEPDKKLFYEQHLWRLIHDQDH